MGWRVGKVWFLIGLQPWPVANPEVGRSVPLPLWGNSVVLASSWGWEEADPVP